MAGLRVQLSGDIEWIQRRAAAVDPFRTPRPFDHSVDVHVARLETAPEAVGTHDYAFERTDLRYVANAARTKAQAWLDESRGAFEAMLELALQTSLLPNGGLVVHASCGVHAGEAWLMPGPSGAGKSTAARAGGFDRVLSDEMVVIRREGTGFTAWGTPFWSEGRQLPYDVGSAPLLAVARLNKAPRVAVDDLGPDEAVAHLLRCVALYEIRPEARTRAFDLAVEVISSVRAIELTFPKEGPWVTAAARHMQARSSSTR